MFPEICELIEQRTGFTKDSGALQVGHRIQSAPERCILVAEPGGGEPNFYCRDMMNLDIQVVSRAKTYFSAREDSWTVFRALHGQSGLNMPRLEGSGEDYLAMTIEAISTPAYIGQDGNGRYEFSTNYIFRCEEGSCGTEPGS